ncbi:MAG: MetQ/NlpA family ABC transporter substrate-binding protein [Lactobacillus sp.]|nr:MetQ/NlpA family ABC transporter substrate-binding protein [Lactobacillus sp.]
MKKSVVFVAALLSLALVVAGCGTKKAAKDTQSTKTTIKVGTSPGPYSELFLKGVKPILEKKGYTVKQTDFTDLLQADVALDAGDIDLNVDQHTAYLEDFNKNKKAHLVGITPIPTVPAGLFGGSKTSLKQVADGDKIGIPDDASNTARALLLLQDVGWIKLKAGVDPITATIRDIAKNPKHLNIVAANSAQIPRTLKDFAYAVIPGSMVYNAKLDASKSLRSEKVAATYELQATVTKKNQNTKWAKAVVAAYRSQAFKKYLAKHNKDNYWYVPKELR